MDEREMGIDMLLKQVSWPPGKGHVHVDDAQLLAYRRGELDAVAVRAVDRALAECRDCRALLEAYAEVEGLPLEEPPAAVPSWWRSLSLVAAVAALFALAVLARPDPSAGTAGLGLELLQGQVASHRGASEHGPGPVVVSGGTLRFLIRADQPRQPQDEAISLFVQDPTGGSRRVPELQSEPTKSGGYRASVPSSALFDAEGAYVLRFVVHPDDAPPEAVPGDVELQTVLHYRRAP